MNVAQGEPPREQVESFPEGDNDTWPVAGGVEVVDVVVVGGAGVPADCVLTGQFEVVPVIEGRVETFPAASNASTANV